MLRGRWHGRASCWRGILASAHTRETIDFDGKHLSVKAGKQLYPTVQRPHPPLWFRWLLTRAHELAAEQVDVYLTWGEPPAAVAEKIADVKRRAAAHGRTLSYGIRLHVIVRETEDEAWRAASELLSHLDEVTVAAAQERFSQMDSLGQRRMAEQNKGRFNRANIREGLEIAPNLWAGVGLVRGGAGTALVGSAQQVADRHPPRSLCPPSQRFYALPSDWCCESLGVQRLQAFGRQ